MCLLTHVLKAPLRYSFRESTLLRRPHMTAIRPPEFFPRLPYAALMLRADRFVLADTFAFSRQGAHNRARIRTSQGRQWLTVPRKHAGESVPLIDTGVVSDDWGRRHLHAIRTAYGMAPFYDHLLPELTEILSTDWKTLADLASATTAWTSRQLGSGATFVRASDLPDAPDTLASCWMAGGSGRLLTLAESATRDAEALSGLAIDVETMPWSEPERRQVFPGFVPDLSVLDLLMTHGPEAASILLDASVGSV